MSTHQAPAPTLHNVGTKPRVSRKLFVSVPVNDLQRSIEFFEAMGFTFSQQFTDATAACMLVGEDAYFMLLTREKFASFTTRPIGDARQAVSVGLSSKYPPAKPGALGCEPLKAAEWGTLTRPRNDGHPEVAATEP